MPIHGASIFSNQLGSGTSSKVDGSFALKNLSGSELTIEISMIGYKKTNRVVALKSVNNDINKIYLDVDTLKFQELNVNAHSKIEEYHKVLKSTLALTIQEQTGLSIRSMGQGTAQPVLRGYKGHRFLLTDDGVATGDLSSTSIDHAVSTDMGAYSRVEIIRGPEALLYGSNTIGGVIDLSRDINNNNRFKKLMVQTLLGTESANKGHFQNVTIMGDIECFLD